MTTIVYRDGVVAADRRGSTDRWIMPGLEVKVRRLADGRIIAGCGGTAEITTLACWVLGDRLGPQPKNDATVIVFDGGFPEVFEVGGFYREGEADFYAWGSGAAPALGALYAGAPAVLAVECAAKVDVYTGGGVDFMEVRP